MKRDIYYNGRIYKDCEYSMPLSENYIQPWHMFPQDLRDFEKRIITLTSYPYTGNNLKDGQVVVQGKDFCIEGTYGHCVVGNYDDRKAMPVEEGKEDDSQNDTDPVEQLFELLQACNMHASLHFPFDKIESKFSITRK